MIYLPSPFRHGGSTASLSALDNAAVAVSLNPAHHSPGKRQQVLMAAEATRLSLPNLDPIDIEEVTSTSAFGSKLLSFLSCLDERLFLVLRKPATPWSTLITFTFRGVNRG